MWQLISNDDDYTTTLFLYISSYSPIVLSHLNSKLSTHARVTSSSEWVRVSKSSSRRKIVATCWEMDGFFVTFHEREFPFFRYLCIRSSTLLIIIEFLFAMGKILFIQCDLQLLFFTLSLTYFILPFYGFFSIFSLLYLYKVSTYGIYLYENSLNFPVIVILW